MSFLSTLPPHGSARDAVILGAIATGNLDTPEWIPVTCGRVTLRVSADYLKIQGARVPMSAPVAQAAVNSLGAVLPTPKIVQAIEAAARENGRIVPFMAWPHWQDNSQLATSTILWRENNIGPIPPGVLVAGCLKDIVVAPRLAGMLDRVLIFGGLDAKGKRVQKLQTSATAHGAYFDGGYAHAVRAVLDVCEVDGQPALVSELYRDDTLSAWLSDEGPLPVVRYPLAAGMAAPHSAVTPSQDQPGGSHVTATPAPSTSAPAARNPSPAAPFTLPTTAILRRGHRGEAVRELQRLLAAAGYVLARDGLYGPATEAAVREYQEERGLQADGIAGPVTLASLRGRVVGEVADADPGDFDVTAAPSPLGDAERMRLFGAFEWIPAPRPDEPSAIKILGTWVADNFTTITIPQLVGVTGAPSGRVFCHRRAAPTILRFFANVEKAGKKHLILSFDGCTNFRRVRGGESLSNHCWGTDIDVNARWNVRGTQGAAKGQKGSMVELFPIAVDSGMGLGINWPTPDPHHLGVLVPE